MEKRVGDLETLRLLKHLSILRLLDLEKRVRNFGILRLLDLEGRERKI